MMSIHKDVDPKEIEDFNYENYSKLWRYSGIDWNQVGRYKLSDVEIKVEDCDGDVAYLKIKKGEKIILDDSYAYEGKAYRVAEDYLVSIGFLVRDETYKRMKFPRPPKKK